MTEPTAPRPVPGPHRPGAAPVTAPGGATTGSRPAPTTESPAAESRNFVSPASATPVADEGTPPAGAGAGRRLGALEELPVPEHVAVFEAEHARLQRELGTIDPR